MKITTMTKFSTKKKREKQVVFEEETLLLDKACKECYKQKQKLINENDYDEDDHDEDDEIHDKKNACNNYYKQNRTRNNRLFHRME